MSYSSRSQRRRFIVLDFICGHFQQHFYGAFAETAIHELAVKYLTPTFDSPPQFFTECEVSAIWRQFSSIFFIYMLNVRRISTSGLFDLLT